MIQSNTFLNVIDNSGAKIVSCIRVAIGYKRRYASLGDIILVSVKELRAKRRSFSKTKKGEIYPALIIRTLITNPLTLGDKLSFLENSVILLNKQNKVLGTRIFGVVPKYFRYTKFLKMVSLSAGFVF